MTDEQLKFILQLKEEGKTREEIAQILGVKPRNVKDKLHKYYQKYGGYVEYLKAKDEPKEEVQEETQDFFDEKDSTLFSTNRAKENKARIAKIIDQMFGKVELKILVINDGHVPFQDLSCIRKAVKENEDADILVINGDFLDLFAVSKFSKDKNIDLKREIKQGREILEELAKQFPLVILVRGNHESRLGSYIGRQISPDLQFLFQKDIQEIIAGEFQLELSDWKKGRIEHYKKISNVVVVGDWWIQIKKTVFAHPNTFSSVPGRTVIQMSTFLKSRNIYHDCVVIGHTHKSCKIMHQGILCMETGCTCFEMDYHSTGNLTFDPWVKGWGKVLIDENGGVNINESHFYVYED